MKLWWLFAMGSVFAPLAILAHEAGHYAVLVALYDHPHIHYGYTGHERSLSEIELQLATAAGPVVTATMSLTGLFWLARRRPRLKQHADLLDWAATFLALCVMRWLRGTAHLVGKVRVDEEILSNGLGLPSPALPYVLLPLAVFIVAWTMYLHPAGQRLFPFVAAIGGILFGVFVWLKLLGPKVLP
jgi:hypothetical protein